MVRLSVEDPTWAQPGKDTQGEALALTSSLGKLKQDPKPLGIKFLPQKGSEVPSEQFLGRAHKGLLWILSDGGQVSLRLQL